jgi:hypothetical protein
MSYDHSSGSKRSPAPCIVDTGTVVNKQDIQRLLVDLHRVRYIYTQDGSVSSQGEGFVREVFADASRATLIANYSLYLNLLSFDYMELGYADENKPCFDLVQETRQLRLIPLSNPLQDDQSTTLNAAALEAMVVEVLSAGLDVQTDDEEYFPF